MISKRRLVLTAAVAALLVGGGQATAGAAAPAATPVLMAAPRSGPARAFVRFTLPKEPSARELYVGQSVPVTVRAYFLGGTSVTLNGPPRVVSDGFTLSDVAEKPRQTATEIRGVPYTELAWTGILTAVKTGAVNPTIEVPTTLSYVETSTRRRHDASADGDNASSGNNNGTDPAANALSGLLAGTPFASDPFFSQMLKGHDPFGGMLDFGAERQQRDVTLRDQARPVAVRALPAGRPDEFTGAVGRFDVKAAFVDQRLRAGEPTTLAIRVSGRGSFDRLDTKGVSSSDKLRTYGMKTTFAPAASPIVGEKTFAETVVPEKSGALTVPPITIAFFDPQKRSYVTRSTPPLSVTVDEGTPGDVPAFAAVAATKANAPAPVATLHGGGLDVAHATLTPLFRTPLYWWLVAAIVGASGILAGIGWARSSASVKRLRQASAVHRALAARKREMAAAAARGDALALFVAARAAVQASLGARWHVPAEAISGADVEARLGGKGQNLRAVFEQADRWTYAGSGGPTGEDLDRWRGLVLSELHGLEEST